MDKVVPFNKKTVRERKRPKSWLIVHHPADQTVRLGQVEDFGTYVIVRPEGWRSGQPRYLLDTAVEGIRLLLRLHGLHHATVTLTRNGAIISLKPQFAGEPFGASLDGEGRHD